MKLSSFALFLAFADNSPWVDADDDFWEFITPPVNEIYVSGSGCYWGNDPSDLCCTKRTGLCGKTYTEDTVDSQGRTCCDSCDSRRRRMLKEEEGAVLAILKERATKKGATIISYKEERDDLLQLCKNEEYQGALVASAGPHFSFVALAQEPKFPECSMFGFDSGLGQKIMLKSSVDSFKKFSFQDATFHLDDAFQAFDKAKPLESDGTSLAEDSCVHFAERIWLKLGLPWSEELGYFIVDTVVSDDNFINTVRLQGGRGLIAASKVGRDALKSQVERVVFSHGARRGLKTSKDYDTSARDLRALSEEDGCSDEDYEVSLVISDSGIGAFVKPYAETSPCGSFYFTANTLLEKHYSEVDSISDALEYLTDHHGIVETEGVFPFASIADAYEQAEVFAYGHDHEDFDIALNNKGDFIAHFFEKLGHCSSEGETALIAAAIANVIAVEEAAEIRLSLASDGVDTSSMTDEAVVTLVVEMRTQNIYCTN